MNDEKIRMPLVRAIQQHVKQKPVSFHVPGHKSGGIVPAGMEAFKDILPYDLTEIEGMDDLHDPTGPVKEAEELLAACYSASRSFFLVGGTTVGNLAMVYALCSTGDHVLVQRNCHKSILHSVELAGVTPVYVDPQVDEQTGIALGLNEDTLRMALSQYPYAKALILTYPSYYGVSTPIAPIIEAAKQAGLLVFVDEAHGAHFSLGPPFPPSSLPLGADIVVQSAHKTLPALTMGSYLHLGDNLKESQVQKIKRALTIFQSSSPSYLIMASLDAARAYLHSYNSDQLNDLLQEVKAFKDEIRTIPQLELVDWEKSGYSWDPLKVTIRSMSHLTGYELQEKLHDAAIDVELADDQHILLVLGLERTGNISEIIDKIKDLLAPFDIIDHRQIKEVTSNQEAPTIEEYYGDIHTYHTRKIPFWEADGRVAAEAVIPYPPGIPLLYPGQKIHREILDKIHRLQQAGARFQGEDVVVKGIYVVELEEER
ncbi:aminotransferase class I/II-fold pyridoxal phosphate-dependent enzyme [Alkalicoccobacillus gibsonii]|uniref:aminotransferase class I/II-fold pyridoxal phosphate-dependent enzyme n=1 Tax=Alkalicoccobacillus gibsonii TaxID=79881 RepID=UPI003517CC9F